MQPHDWIVRVAQEHRSARGCVDSRYAGAGECLSPGYYFVLPKAPVRRRRKRCGESAPMMFGPYESQTLARLIAVSARALGLVEEDAAEVVHAGKERVHAVTAYAGKLPADSGRSCLPQLYRSALPVALLAPPC